MNEIQFIEDNKDRWQKTERYSLDGEARDVDELTNLYILLNDDLAYASTFYPKSKTTQYLNQLLLGLHQKLYSNKKVNKGFFKKFVFHDVPRICYEHRAKLYLSFAIFIGFCLIGLFSGNQDNDLVNLILGDSYVRMTEANIEQGDPLGVYGKSEQTSMFLRISTNNIRVAFLAYLLGLMACVGTVVILLYNGLMVGVFLYYFIGKGLFELAFSTIMIHGALELSAIALAGAAGMIAGYHMIRPGTYSRAVAFRKGIKDSFLLLLSVALVLAFAAVLESFVTRHYLELGSVIRWGIVTLSFAFIIVYYFVFPYRYHKKHNPINESNLIAL